MNFLEELERVARAAETAKAKWLFNQCGAMTDTNRFTPEQ